ncbi:Resolvase, N terminal domain [Peribacillus simplex]|uniref:Resolvase, N terminal domain n=1 Tax=Peribacillus simplex TaxID=1478 RepID=A0A9X8WM56_9BACI|nr:Resolvase, N terminal domain [Peribacillus simplex]
MTARVSTTGQDLETQNEILANEGCEKLFVEKVTGTSTKQRTQLYEAMEFAREGDTLVVTKIDRLARSIMDLNKIVQGLAEKGVKLDL